jgi:hypothetical protein
MPKRAQQLASEILRLQIELDREIEKRRRALGWRIKENFVEFEEGVIDEHRRLRAGIAGFLAGSSVGKILTAPIIYSLIIPFAIIDAWASLYQAICFRAYRIPQVKRSPYIVFDRQQLAYLNVIQIVNCAFCSYANGVIAYVREIGSRTEQYWCPIKHALKVTSPHQRYYEFLEYGDAEDYQARVDQFRERLRTEGGPPRADV